MAKILVALRSYVVYVIEVESTGSLKPDLNADITRDSWAINDAFGYWDTKQSTFVEILPYRTCAQRVEIYNKLLPEYRDSISYYNHDDGDICYAVKRCFHCTPVEYYRTWIYYGVQDLPYMDTKMLIDLLVLLSFEDQGVRDGVLLENHYYEYWRRGRLRKRKSESLPEYWQRNVDDDFGNWELEMLKRKRDPPDAKTDPEAAKADAKALMEEKEKDFDDCRLKLDEVLAQRTSEQARLVLDEFKSANDGKDIMDVLRDHLGGDIENAYMDLITCIREGRVNYLAIRLKEVMDGAGTDDVNLGRLIIYLSEIDLVEVSAAFQQKYGKSLKSRMEEDLSGFTKDFLFGFMGDLAKTER